MMKKLALFFGFTLVMVLVSACAPGGARFEEASAGFWMGLWHGIISLFTFIVSLFSDSVKVYELNNSGHLYDLGFILGVSIFYGGGSKSCCRR